MTIAQTVSQPVPGSVPTASAAARAIAGPTGAGAAVGSGQAVPSMFADVLAGAFGPDVAAGRNAIAGAAVGSQTSQTSQAPGRSRPASAPGDGAAKLEVSGPVSPEAKDAAAQGLAMGLAGAASVEAPRATVWGFAGLENPANGSAPVAPAGEGAGPQMPGAATPAKAGAGQTPVLASPAGVGAPAGSAAPSTPTPLENRPAGTSVPTASVPGSEGFPGTAGVDGEVATNARLSEIWGASLDGDAQTNGNSAARGPSSASVTIASSSLAGTDVGVDLKGQAGPTQPTVLQGGGMPASAQPGSGEARDGSKLSNESGTAERARSVNARLPEAPVMTGTPGASTAADEQALASQAGGGQSGSSQPAGPGSSTRQVERVQTSTMASATAAVAGRSADAPSSSEPAAAPAPARTMTPSASVAPAGNAASPAVGTGDVLGDATVEAVRRAVSGTDRASGDAVTGASTDGGAQARGPAPAMPAATGTPVSRSNISVSVQRTDALTTDDIGAKSGGTDAASAGSGAGAEEGDRADAAGTKSRDTARADGVAVDTRTGSQPQIQRSAQLSLAGAPAGSGTIASDGAAVAEARDLLYGYDGSSSDGSDGASAKDNTSSGRQTDSASVAGTARPDTTSQARSGVSAPAMAFAAAMAEASGDVSLSDDPALLGGASGLDGGRGDPLAQAQAQISQTVRGGQNPVPHMAALATSHLAAEVARFAGKGETRFQIRMDPPELGRVDVELKFSKDGKVKAHLTVDRSETLDMFMRDQRGLERALDAAGLKLDPGSVELSLRDQGAGGFAQQQGMSDGSGQDANGSAGGVARGDETGEADREAVSFSRVQVAGSTGSLDIHI